MAQNVQSNQFLGVIYAAECFEVGTPTDDTITDCNRAEFHSDSNYRDLYPNCMIKKNLCPADVTVEVSKPHFLIDGKKYLVLPPEEATRSKIVCPECCEKLLSEGGYKAELLTDKPCECVVNDYDVVKWNQQREGCTYCDVIAPEEGCYKCSTRDSFIHFEESQMLSCDECKEVTCCSAGYSQLTPL